MVSSDEENASNQEDTKGIISGEQKISAARRIFDHAVGISRLVLPPPVF